MKHPSEWTKVQKVTGTIGSGLATAMAFVTIVVWAGDTRWVQIADAHAQSRQISDFVNIEQYSYRREVLIVERIGQPPAIQEGINAQIQILDNRINSLEGKHE